MSERAQRKFGGRLRLPGFLITLFCLCGVVCGVILSRTFDSGNAQPVGIIVASDDAVLRRAAGRTIWGKLTVGSRIYSGDTIRTADASGTTLYVERNSIDLDEKTLIRIQRSPDDGDAVLIYFDEGNLVITTAPGGGNIALNLMGRQVEIAPGTILSASAGKDGGVVQVSEGSAMLTGEMGEKREIAPGTMIALDAAGAERMEKVAAVPQPRPDTASRAEQAERVPLEHVPLLPEPLNRLPPTGYRIGIDQVKESDHIDFTWSTVPGANAYIFTLYMVTEGNPGTGNGRRQIFRGQPRNHTKWTLENLAVLGNETFAWQVEAVNMSSAGTVERRGRIIENSFIIDIPRPGQVQIENPGTLYGY
jgi:quercetin dioxygenase-like cupin family protein